ARSNIFGTGTVNGVTYSGFGPLGSVSLVSFGGTTMTFDVAAMTIPDAAPVGTRVSFALPFTMAGFLTLAPTTQFYPTPILGDPVFSNEVAGSGTLNFSLTSGQLGSETLWGLTHPANFVFASSVAPTPEPASVLLLGAGLVGVARRYRRQ